MSSDTHTPSKRNWISFINLMVMQTQNSFNDKALQYILIPLGVWLATVSSSPLGDKIEYFLAALILIPFILFAPLCGWLSDVFSKKRIIFLSALFQLIILLLASLCIYTRNLNLGILAFFLLALQSAILSPSKTGIIKELIGSKNLGFASGLQEMCIIIAILSGTIIMGFWFGARLDALGDGWLAASLPMYLLTIGGIISIIASLGIEKTPPKKTEPFHWSIATRHFHQLSKLFRKRALRLSALGVAYFWFFGGFIQLTCIQIAKKAYANHPAGFAPFNAKLMLAAGIGIIIGSLIASRISRKRIELGLIPLGGLLMVLGTFATFLFFRSNHPENPALYLTLIIAGAGSAIFLVPVNAWLQDKADPTERGSTLAASNLLNCFGGIIAVSLQGLSTALKLSSNVQFLIIALFSLAVTIYVTRLIPAETVRLVGHYLIRKFYRLKAHHTHLIPEKGGVLLCPNHISYHDAFVLSASCPRPVRFLMFDELYNHPLYNPLCRLFNTVPVSSKKAKEALKTAAETLKNGDVICIFPEGQLTRTGAINEIKAGFQLVARMANCPIIPVNLSGIWGLPMTDPHPPKHWINRHYRKPDGKKARVHIRYGAPLTAKEASPEVLREKLFRLQKRAIRRQTLTRDTHYFDHLIKTAQPATDSLNRWESLAHYLRALSKAEKLRHLETTLQLSHLHLFQKNDHLHLHWPKHQDNAPWALLAAHHKMTLHLETTEKLSDSPTLREDQNSPNDHKEAHHHIHPEHFSQEQNFSHKLRGLQINGKVYKLSVPNPITGPRQMPQFGNYDGEHGIIVPGTTTKELENLIAK